MKIKFFFFLAVFLIMLRPYMTAATGFQPERPSVDTQSVDTQCVTDDENFTKFFDFLALIFAIAGCLVIPSLIPMVPKLTNRWRWADPWRRWRLCATIFALLFFFVIFLPPQLARVSQFFRPFGLALLHSLGNIRLEYLDCDLQKFPRDYGFFYFLRWSPGPNLMISYWYAQLAVFAVYAALTSTVYFALVVAIAKSRLVALAK